MEEKIKKFAEDLLSLPNEIFALQVAMIEMHEDSQEISEKITLRESEIKSEINAATDENGKKMYSNEESRKIAFLNDASSDSELVDLGKKKRELDVAVQSMRAKIEMKSNLQRNLRSIMGVMAGLSVEA
jgi:hypothetical protein